MKPRSFTLDAKAIAMAGASVLALDPSAIGRTFALSPEDSSDNPWTNRFEGSSEVAIVSVSGPLTQKATAFLCGYSDGYDAITRRFAAALEDDRVGSVVLVIDSPGGDAAGLIEAVKRMRAMRADSGKKVFAYADELAASAAYAIACVADGGIFLPSSGSVGSVGTIAVHATEARALSNEGVDVTVFRSGKRKADVNGVEALSDDARERMQSMVNALAADFAAFVGEARGMDAAAVLALQGELFLGPAAVAAGLANGVSSLEGVIAMAMDAAEMQAAAHAWGAVRASSPALATKTNDEAIGTILAWEKGAARAEELQSELEKRDAAAAEAKAKADAEERFALVRSAVAETKLAPVVAYSDEGHTKLAPAYAEMSLATLRAHVAALPRMNKPAPRAPEPSSSSGLTDAETEFCVRNGIDPKAFAESKAYHAGKPANEE